MKTPVFNSKRFLNLFFSFNFKNNIYVFSQSGGKGEECHGLEARGQLAETSFLLSDWVPGLNYNKQAC